MGCAAYVKVFPFYRGGANVVKAIYSWEKIRENISQAYS